MCPAVLLLKPEHYAFPFPLMPLPCPPPCLCWQDQWTPLHWACKGGHTEAISALLAAGADPNAKDKVSVPCCALDQTGEVWTRQ